MKVLHLSVLPFYTVDTKTGAGMPSILHSILEFVDRNWDVELVYIGPKVNNDILLQNIKSINIMPKFYLKKRSAFGQRIFSVLKPWFDLMVLLKATRTMLFRKKDYDLVYLHGSSTIILSWLFKFIVPAPIIGRMYGVYHFKFLLNPRFSIRNILWAIPEYLALKSPIDLMIITDDGTFGDEVSKKYGIAHKTICLRNGVNVPDWVEKTTRNTCREKLGISRSSTIITYIGRLAVWKKVDRVLKVAKYCKENGSDWIFVIIGSGEEELKLHQYKDEHELSNVIFTGPIAHENIWLYLKASNIFFALPNISSFSNTLIEALSCEIPVVCSSFGEGIEQVVGDCGILVKEPDDYFQVYDALERVLQIDRYAQKSNSFKFCSWEKRMKEEYEVIFSIIQKAQLSKKAKGKLK